MSKNSLNKAKDVSPASHSPEDTAAEKIEQELAVEDAETVRLNAEVPKRHYERFKRKCEQEGLSISEVVRRFVRVFAEDVE